MTEDDEIYVDATLAAADWAKTTWDLPTDPEWFLSWVGGEKGLKSFMKLPAAKAMPPDLRAALGV